jgi:hypothetical protein
MKTRTMQIRDRLAIEAIHASVGYEFPLPGWDSNLVESAQVLTDDEDNVIMAGFAIRVPEVYLLCPQGGAMHPAVKMEGVAMLHGAMRDELAPKGYSQAFSFIWPKCAAFGRHLMRRFGWEKCWAGYHVRILDWKADPRA